MIRKNLVLLIFILAGMTSVLLFLNFRTTSQVLQKAKISNTLLSGFLPVRLSKSEVTFFNLGKFADRVFFYEKIDSIVYEISFDGKNKKEITRIPGVHEMIFSPDHSQIIAAVSELGKSGKYYFNLTENKRIALDSKIKTAAFSPDGSKIAYHLYDTDSGEGNISVAGPGNSDPVAIFKTRIKDLELTWPEDDAITIRSKNENGSTPVFLLKPDGSDFKKINEIKSDGLKETSILEKSGIEISAIETSSLGNYLVYLNAKDKKLYSLRIR